jgi:hypothetical protein
MTLKNLLMEFWSTKKHRERKLNYVIAVSSGAPIGGEIPTLLHRRIGWATRQGANFVEVYAISPAEVLMETDGMIYVAKQMGLNYSFHPSANIGFDTSYRVAGGGFDIANKFLRDMVMAIGALKEKMEELTEKKHTVTSINIHLAIHPIPPVDERLAADVSVDPFGRDIREIKEDSKIWGNKRFRERFWIGYIKKMLVPGTGILISLLRRFDFESYKKMIEPKLDEFFKKMEISEDEFKKWSFEKKIASIPDHVLDSIEAELDRNPKTEEKVKNKFIENLKILEALVGTRFLPEDEIMKESFIFRQLLPRWMPHAEEKEIRDMWGKITGKKSFDPEKAEKELEMLLKEDVRGEEKMIAAVAGAYIWGHITQIKSRAPEIAKFRDKKEGVSIGELLAYYGLQLTLESHVAGTADVRVRVYAPEDVLAISQAINATIGKDVTRITIDMEQISTMGIDPLWTIKGNKEQGYRGLGNNEGRYIRVVHVTHPYIAGEGRHEHGPIRRGDTQIFEYLYEMVQRGMGSNEKEPTIIMYEIGGEKAESIYMLRLIMNMIEHGIIPEDLKGAKMLEIAEKERASTIKEQLIQEFFGISKVDFEHEKRVVIEHALDPLKGMMGSTKFEHTWTARAAIQRGTPPEEYRGEEYR